MPIDERLPQEAEARDSIERIIDDLRKKGLRDDEILKSLEDLLRNQEISEEDYAKAKELLKARDDAEDHEENERKEAERLFGVDFIK